MITLREYRIGLNEKKKKLNGWYKEDAWYDGTMYKERKRAKRDICVCIGRDHDHTFG